MLSTLKNTRFLKTPSNKEYLFILLMPVINAIADVTIYYFTDVDEVSGIHPGIIRGLLISTFILYFVINRMSFFKTNTLIFIFLLYLLILSFLSSNVNRSLFSGFLKWSVPLLSFSLGYYYIRNEKLLRQLNTAYVFAALVIILNFAVAQVTKQGISAYIADSFYTGGGGVGVTNCLTFILLTIPAFFVAGLPKNKTLRIMIPITMVLSILVIVAVMKRAAIFGLILGYFIYFINSKKKTVFFKYFIIIGILFLLFLPKFESVITERFNARVEISSKADKEIREEELTYVIQEFLNTSVKHSLFGSEVFNSQQFFGPKYFDNNRMIHGDFASFLYGSGLVGILLYFSIFFSLYRFNKFYDKNFKDKNMLTELNAVFYAILVTAFFVSATGSGSVGERSLVYLYLGAIIGIKEVKVYQNVYSKQLS